MLEHYTWDRVLDQMEASLEAMPEVPVRWLIVGPYAAGAGIGAAAAAAFVAERVAGRRHRATRCRRDPTAAHEHLPLVG